ncbi:hypothetical protein N182_25045 [Sinorhizobium sp. GL2]|nr:hypothetical protein N182_25045 [Sinorhizobium sp. GL2]
MIFDNSQSVDRVLALRNDLQIALTRKNTD